MVPEQIGQYHVIERIGQGGMGSIYRATDEMLDREVALKVLDVDVEDCTTRFRAEAVSLARLNHPGIAAVYELFQHDSQLVMVMELVRGQTLQQVVEHAGVFSPQRAAEVCMEVLLALAHAHGAGIVHRDLKPSNLMMTETGAVKILDFGIARLDGSVHLTQAGFMMGTPAYMAPEQVQGQAIDARVDLYAMGVVFYRLICAKLPFQGETPFAMAQSQVNDPPTPIELVRPDLPPWVGRITAHALAKAPEERFQSAMEFHEAFARCLAGLPLASSVQSDGPTEAMARPESLIAASTHRTGAEIVRRSRRGMWAGVAAAGIMVCGLLWFGLPSRGAAFGAADEQTRALDRGAFDHASATPAVEPAVQQSITPASLLTGAAGPAPAKKVADDNATASALFNDVKLLTVTGARTNAVDVSLAFLNGQIMAVPAGGTDPLASLPYRGIAKATYVYARDPQWQSEASAPADKINLPGILGRRRHWLVVQTAETYAILRLDSDNWSEVLKAFEGITGVTIGRPLATDR